MRIVAFQGVPVTIINDGSGKSLFGKNRTVLRCYRF